MKTKAKNNILKTITLIMLTIAMIAAICLESFAMTKKIVESGEDKSGISWNIIEYKWTWKKLAIKKFALKKNGTTLRVYLNSSANSIRQRI